MTQKKALICGVSGQDGAYLASFLLGKGYLVYGTSRDAEMSSFQNLLRLGIRHQVQLDSMSLNDFRSVLQVLIKVQPDEVYNLAGQSSVGLSFAQPVETLESIATGTLNLLEAIRFTGKPIKFYNAGSSECFGDIGDRPAAETTPFRPRSPYAVAKSAAFWQVANYREAYGLFACSGILFNHDSPLRPPRFVTQKIVTTACRIAQGVKNLPHPSIPPSPPLEGGFRGRFAVSLKGGLEDASPFLERGGFTQEKLYLGNISIQRDWGWAPEYVEAMYLMLQQPQPDDYVIATGESYSLQDFVAQTFTCLGLNWQEYVVSDPNLLRPTDLTISKANPTKAREKLGWVAQYKMHDIVKMMVEARMNKENKL